MAPIVRLRFVMDRTLLLEQAAEVLGVSRRTIYYRIQSGRLQTVRTRCGSQRVRLDSIEQLMREESERLTRRAAGVSDTDPSAKSPGL